MKFSDFILYLDEIIKILNLNFLIQIVKILTNYLLDVYIHSRLVMKIIINYVKFPFIFHFFFTIIVVNYF